MILYLDKIKLIADKHEEPKFSAHHGRKWVTANIYIDGCKTKCHFDKSFGNNVYFKYNNHSHRVPMKGEYYHIVAGVISYSFNPAKEKVEFTTQAPDSPK